MKYYLVRIGEDKKHRVVGEVPLTKSTKLIIDDTLPSGESQYLCPEIMVPYLNKIGLGITTTAKTLDKIFTYESWPMPDDLDEGLDLKTGLDDVR